MDCKFFCPIFNKNIDDAFCYEVNMVMNNLIKPESVCSFLDRKKHDEICKKCPHYNFK
jgi:hypothetical protein